MIRSIGAPVRSVHVVLGSVVALAACASSDTSYHIETDGPLRVKDAWVRATNVTGPGAMYLTLENTDTAAVTILGAATPLAGAAEFHETTEMQGMEGMSHMNKLDSIPVARGATLAMKPGGLHIMLIDLKKSLTLGDTVPLVIRLSDGRTTSVKAIAREQ